MKKSLNLLKQLPFTFSYKSSLGSFLPVKTILRNLGNTFYPRLIKIHENLTESLVLNDTQYLQKALIPELYEALSVIKEEYKLNGCRLKLNQPTKKLLTNKNFILP